VVVGDATGKGVPAALVMSTTSGMLRLAAQSSSSPGEMLGRVNEALFPYIPTNMFVTCFYAILDPKSGYLVYANAGHDLPYVRRGSEAEELRARGMPLGLMTGMRYEEGEASLREEHGVLFYSDGLVEAHDPADLAIKSATHEWNWRGREIGGPGLHQCDAYAVCELSKVS
jgi:serine phosphatase RsbU (regulator of sigma subunit)